MKCLLFLLIISSSLAVCQVPSGIYFSENDSMTYEIKVTEDYFILSTYQKEPATFIQTVGGYYVTDNDHIKVNMEFNSDYEKDSVKMIDIPYDEEGGILILRLEPELVFNKVEENVQDLDSQWLFATRGPDNGQERRGDENARKTLKFLMDGRFQWIAYNTESMKFFGTGGGSYTAEDGKYAETIEYFSRDNSRVGAVLTFDYEIKGKDWHHQGLNSRGEPMYEIWSKR